MKNKLVIPFILLLINFSLGQSRKVINFKGDAKLIGSWSKEKNKDIQKEVSFKSTALDNFKFFWGAQSLNLSVSYKNNGELLSQIEGGPEEINVYEYDFGGDDDVEYIIVEGYKSFDIRVKIYKISKGLTKLIGSFTPQNEIEVTPNFIIFPFGGQGQVEEFYFRDNAFYSLMYHKPRKDW